MKHTRKVGVALAFGLGSIIAAACGGSSSSTTGGGDGGTDGGAPSSDGSGMTDTTLPSADSGDANPTTDGNAGDANGSGTTDGSADANPSTDDAGPTVDAGDAGDFCLGRYQGLLTLPVSGITGPATGTGHLVSTPSCASSANGPEDVYGLQLASAQGVFVKATTTGGAPVVRLLDSCASTSDVSCSATDPSASGVASLRASLPAGTYDLVIGQTLTGGSNTPAAYTLSASTFTPASNVTCAAATALAAGTDGGASSVTGNSSAGLTMDSLCGRSSDAGHLYYTVSVAPNDEWTVTVQPEGSWTALVEVLDSCGSTTCSQTAASASAGAPTAVTIFGPESGSPTTAVISVRSSDGTKTGPFSIDVTSSCTLALGTQANCSRCGDNCGALETNASLHVASASCAAPSSGAGTCEVVCADGYADCDGLSSNGCEVSLASASTCGGCKTQCTTQPTGGQTCEISTAEDAGADGGYACVCDPSDGVIVYSGNDMFGKAASCLNNNPPTLPWCFYDGQDGFCLEEGPNWTCCLGWKAGATCDTAVNDCCVSDSSLPPPGICCQNGNAKYPQCQDGTGGRPPIGLSSPRR